MQTTRKPTSNWLLTVSRKMVLCATLAAAVTGSWLASSASAAMIDLTGSITNPSFETPALVDGAYTGTITGWLTYTDHGNGFAIVSNPDTNAYSSGSPADGSNMLAINAQADFALGFVVYQDIPVTLLPGTIYTLTVAIGNRIGGHATDTFKIELDKHDSALNSNSSLARYDGLGSDLTADSWTNKTISYTATAADAGKTLTIFLGVDTAAKTYSQVTDFDNVRLTSAPIPEPGTITLLAAGWLACAWRRRRSACQP